MHRAITNASFVQKQQQQLTYRYYVERERERERERKREGGETSWIFFFTPYTFG
jgi:hypothetical protein